MFRKTTLLAACAGAVGVGAHRAEANVTEAHWISSTSFSYRVRYVPDFDQRRAALPGNGSNHCVPTSVMNWSAYIARLGNPSLPPGPAPWNYNGINLNIFVLGLNMNTDPNGGTTASNGVAGAQAWFGGNAIVFVYTGGNGWYPRLHNLANWAISGALVVPRVGWYNESAYPTITRSGGHAVSLVRAARSGSSQLMGIHDPASDENPNDLGAQSPFRMDTYAIEDRVVFPGGGVPAVMARVNGYGGSSTNGYVYGAYVIYPLVALTPLTFNFQIVNANLTNLGQPTHTHIPSANGGAVLAALMGMSPSQYYYIADNPGAEGTTLYTYDRVENTHASLLTLPDNSPGVCSSRHRRLFVSAGRTLHRINPEPGTAGPVEASFVIPGGAVDALAYDDNRDEVVALRSRTRNLVRIPSTLLRGSATTESIPTQVPLEPGGSVDVRFGDGSVLIATPASALAYLLTPDAAAGYLVQPIAIPGNAALLSGGSFTDRGVVLVADGKLHELMQNDQGAWEYVPESVLTGALSSGKVYAGRSRTDVDYATEMDPENADVLPTVFVGATSVAECPADLNGDGVVNFSDLNLVLNSFGMAGQGLPGDVNGDGVVDFRDLNILLNSFAQDCG